MGEKTINVSDTPQPTLILDIYVCIPPISSYIYFAGRFIYLVLKIELNYVPTEWYIFVFHFSPSNTTCSGSKTLYISGESKVLNRDYRGRLSDLNISLFVPFSFAYYIVCLSLFDLRLLITCLASSNFSFYHTEMDLL